MKKKVLIIDESPEFQMHLTKIINALPEFVVVGVASDPKVGAEKIHELSPDILTLDIDLPVMDGSDHGSVNRYATQFMDIFYLENGSTGGRCDVLLPENY